MLESTKNSIELLFLHVAVKFFGSDDLIVKAAYLEMFEKIKLKPRYIPEVMAETIIKLFEENNWGDEVPNWNIERIIINNYIWGDLEKFQFDKHRYPGVTKEDSLIYKIIKGEETSMRVNVVHPMFLSDQHLVAEYREVKMGPKALSRSLGSEKGVDLKRISPVYTLNTGHTYFFYDKNGFLEKRLAQLVKEMQSRGIATNHTELIDDKYDYHPDVFDDKWWGDYQPTVEALNINMERINQRFSIKLDGWYRFWGRPAMDMNDIISTRAQNSFWECSNCKAIHPTPEGDSWVCWNCCKKIPKDTPKISYF